MAEIPAPPTGGVHRDIDRYLAEVERRLERIDRSINLAEFAMYSGRSNEGPERAQLERTRVLSTPGLLHFVDHARGLHLPPVVDRRLELLRRSVIEARVEQSPEIVRARTRLQRRVVRFRPTWKGRKVNRVVVSEVLRTNPDPRERQRAYYSEEPLRRGMEDDLRSLIGLRNDAARATGFDSFPEMRLGFEGLTVARLRQLFDDATTAAPRRIREIRNAFLQLSGQGEWYPWDVAFAREQVGRFPERPFPGRSMVDTIKSALRRWGFPARRLEFRVVRHDLPFAGLTIVPTTPTDVRVLVHPKGGWTYYHVLFHEFGHALHYGSVGQPTHLLRSMDLGFAGFHEGIAGLFEEISVNREWLCDRPGVSPEAVQEFREARGDESLLGTASRAGGVRLELDMYRHPDRDWSETFHQVSQRMYGFGDHPTQSTARGFFVSHPVYAQSYFLSILFRKQVLRSMLKAVGPPTWPNRHVARWLTDRWFRWGGRYDWIERVREVTGEPFGAGAFRESVLRKEP
jgi:peptidyl-dipeptidase A